MMFFFKQIYKKMQRIKILKIIWAREKKEKNFDS